MEGPDSGDVVVNATCRREMVSEMSDGQVHSGDICIKEVEVVVMTELYEELCLYGMLS